MQSMQKKWLTVGAILMMTGEMIGAFGAHALKPVLEANDKVATFDTAVKYHFYHALGLLIIGLLKNDNDVQNKWLNYAGNLMLSGLFIFSGSLYVLCLTNLTFLGAITPMGGLGMIAGWAVLVIALNKQSTKDKP
jgi:uncharacterized membrane protein YgdD (TMEM256/DUF423 family)